MIETLVISANMTSYLDEEQPFLVLVPDWIEQLHGKYCEDKEMSQEYHENLIDSYSKCFIGNLRAKLGLTRFYVGEVYDECNNCRDLAYDMARIRTKTDYLHNLDAIKVHMGVEHQKNI